MTPALEHAVGRVLIAALFVAGAIQKAIDPTAAQALLAGIGLPIWLVWPASMFNATAAVFLIAGWQLRSVGRALALYCVATSIFHLVPFDPWQMSIFVKNWAIAGGCLILSATNGPKRVGFSAAKEALSQLNLAVALSGCFACCDRSILISSRKSA